MRWPASSGDAGVGQDLEVGERPIICPTCRADADWADQLYTEPRVSYVLTFMDRRFLRKLFVAAEEPDIRYDDEDDGA